MTEFARASDGVEIAYDRLGEGPPVLLIHGFAASRVITWKNTHWYDWLPRAGRELIAMDCRGHGESGKPHAPPAYAEAQMVADVLSVVDAVGHSTVDVIGYSMGGYLTVNLLHLAPDRVRRAVVAGVGETYFSFWRDRNEIIAQALLADDTETIADPLAQEFRTFSTRAKNDLKALAACMRRDRLVLAPEDLRGITHPVLVVCGERDTISGRPEPLAELFSAGEAVSVPRKDHHSTVGDLVFKRAARDFLAR